MVSCEHDIKNFGDRIDQERYNKIIETVLEELDVDFPGKKEWAYHCLTRQ